MAATHPSLFSWQDVDILPDMHRLERVLQYLPDQEIVEALEQKRGRGRNDYPVVAGIVFQHRSIEGLVRELRRNPALLCVCGFDLLPRQGKARTTVLRSAGTGRAQVVRVPAPVRDSVPRCWNFYRFLGAPIALEETQGLIARMIQFLREQLLAALPEFGQHLGYDGKAIDSHSTGEASHRRDLGPGRRLG